MTYVTASVEGPAGSAEVRFLVDSGTMYTLLPEPIWRAIGLEPARVQPFWLADGTEMVRSVTDCVVLLPQGRAPTPVILGEPGDDEPLLGMVALEHLGLMLNPLTRQLQPMHLRI